MNNIEHLEIFRYFFMVHNTYTLKWLENVFSIGPSVGGEQKLRGWIQMIKTYFLFKLSQPICP